MYKELNIDNLTPNAGRLSLRPNYLTPMALSSHNIYVYYIKCTFQYNITRWHDTYVLPYCCATKTFYRANKSKLFVSLQSCFKWTHIEKWCSIHYHPKQLYQIYTTMDKIGRKQKNSTIIITFVGLCLLLASMYTLQKVNLDLIWLPYFFSEVFCFLVILVLQVTNPNSS